MERICCNAYELESGISVVIYYDKNSKPVKAELISTYKRLTGSSSSSEETQLPVETYAPETELPAQTAAPKVKAIPETTATSEKPSYNNKIREEYYSVTKTVRTFDFSDESAKYLEAGVCKDFIVIELSGTVEHYSETYTQTVYYVNGEIDRIEDGEKVISEATTDDRVFRFLKNTKTGECSLETYGHVLGEKQTESANGTEVTTYTCTVCGEIAMKETNTHTYDWNKLLATHEEAVYLLIDGKLVLLGKELERSIMVPDPNEEGSYSNMESLERYEEYLIDGTLFCWEQDELILDEGSYCKGKYVYTASDGTTEEEEYERHSFVESFKFAEGATSCEDGIIITSDCMLCDYTETETTYEHNIVWDHDKATIIDLKQYGVECEHIELCVYSCFCKELQNTSVSTRSEFTWEEVEIDGNRYSKYTCSECEFSYLERWVNENKNCVNYEYLELTFGDTVLKYLSSVHESHNRTTSVRVDSECKEETVGDTVVVTEVWDNICYNCTKVISRNVNTETYESTKNLLLSEKNVSMRKVGDKFVVSHQNTCEYGIANGKYLTDVKYNYVIKEKIEWFDNNGECYEWEEAVYSYEDENHCSAKIKYTDSNGNSREYENNSRHVSRIEKYVLRNPDGSCEDGIDYVVYCVNCGELSRKENITNNHLYGNDSKELDIGHNCNSGRYDTYAAYVSSCLCGQNENLSVNGAFSGQAERVEIDGVIGRKYTYTCKDCDYVYTYTRWSEKDEYCNQITHYKYEFGNGLVYSYNKNEGQSHSYTQKELPDESSDVTDEETGIRTVVYAYESYCSDCKASIDKDIDTSVYDKNGALIKEIQADYEYVAISDTETIAQLAEVYTVEYENVKGKYLTYKDMRYVISEKREQYENGELTSWSLEQYEYSDDNHCSYTVHGENGNGFDWDDTYENAHQYTNVYRLSEGSKTCLDGVERASVCAECGNVYDFWDVDDNYHHYNEDDTGAKEIIDLAEYGSVCGTKMVISSCVCGEAKEVEFEGKCEFTHQDWIEIDGVEYAVYGCPVTDPESCGFTYAERNTDHYTSDENCKEKYNITYLLGIDDNYENPKRIVEISYYTGNLRHGEETTVKTETETGYEVTTKCERCDTLISTKKSENFEYVDKYYYYDNLGRLTQVTTEKGFAKDTNRYYYNNDSFETLELYEYYDTEGNVTSWNKFEYVYPRAEEGIYCYYYTVQTDSDGYTYTSPQNVRHNTYSTGNSTCTPSLKNYYCSCCDYEYENYSWSGHSYSYDSNKGVYVCRLCGLENATKHDGNVIFEDLTLREGTGEVQYIVGFVNNYKSDKYIWNVSLVVEGEEDFIILPTIIPVINEDTYRIYLDAAAIAEAAEALGYGACEYMVRLALVPTDTADLDYAITLDPHVFAIDEENSTAPETTCSGEAVQPLFLTYLRPIIC